MLVKSTLFVAIQFVGCVVALVLIPYDTILPLSLVEIVAVLAVDVLLFSVTEFIVGAVLSTLDIVNCFDVTFPAASFTHA